jgi:hypothetical protein
MAEAPSCIEPRSAEAGPGASPFASALGADLIPVDIGIHHRLDIWMTYHPDARRTPRIATIIDWLIGAFDASKFPWFRDEFFHPSAFSEFDSRHWADNAVTGFTAAGQIRDVG